jgi:hypothetical protein
MTDCGTSHRSPTPIRPPSPALPGAGEKQIPIFRHEERKPFFTEIRRWLPTGA